VIDPNGRFAVAAIEVVWKRCIGDRNRPDRRRERNAGGWLTAEIVYEGPPSTATERHRKSSRKRQPFLAWRGQPHRSINLEMIVIGGRDGRWRNAVEPARTPRPGMHSAHPPRLPDSPIKVVPDAGVIGAAMLARDLLRTWAAR